MEDKGIDSDEDMFNDQYYENVSNDAIKVEHITHNSYLLPLFHVNKQIFIELTNIFRELERS